MKPAKRSRAETISASLCVIVLFHTAVHRLVFIVTVNGGARDEGSLHGILVARGMSLQHRQHQ